MFYSTNYGVMRSGYRYNSNRDMVFVVGEDGEYIIIPVGEYRYML